MAAAILLLAFVTLQRLAELVWNRSNEVALRAKGAVEAGHGHYPVMVALHAAWLVALWLFGWDRPLVWLFVGLYALLQLGRIWVLATLGRRWTTRVFVIAGETLVARGPYRFVRHPNYVVVGLEFFILPLAFGLWPIAAIFGVANLALLAWRIRSEDEALRTAVRV